MPIASGLPRARLPHPRVALAVVALTAFAAAPAVGDPAPATGTGPVAVVALGSDGPLASRRAYRAALAAGALTPGLVAAAPLDPARPTVVFVHGANGAPGQFARLAAAIGGERNWVLFAYDDAGRLGPSAELLRRSLGRLPAPPLVIAHSMGTLLVGHVGAMETAGPLCDLGAIYVNPLVGGSRHADDIPWLLPLRPLKRVLHRLFFAASIKDMAPASAFVQTIFGPASRPSCFAARTTILFSERPGDDPGVRRHRLPRFFGRTRAELLARMGTVAPVEPRWRRGHSAPLRHPEIVLPHVEAAAPRGFSSRR